MQSPHYNFPDDDLALELIDLYFANINLYLPLLHRPSFQKSVTEGLHHVDDRFASIYLLVCAIGARYSDDRRVLLDGVESLHSCGWRWFNQVQMVKKSFICPPTLYDLQFYCVRTFFFFLPGIVRGSLMDFEYSFLCIFCKDRQHRSHVGQWWDLGYVWLRMWGCIDGKFINMFRPQRMSNGKEDFGMLFFIRFCAILNKIRRVLVCMDRIISAALGRPCAIHDDEYVCRMYYACNFLPKSIYTPASTSNYLSTVMMSTGIIQIRNNDSNNRKINHL